MSVNFSTSDPLVLVDKHVELDKKSSATLGEILKNKTEVAVPVLFSMMHASTNSKIMKAVSDYIQSKPGFVVPAIEQKAVAGDEQKHEVTRSDANKIELCLSKIHKIVGQVIGIVTNIEHELTITAANRKRKPMDVRLEQITKRKNELHYTFIKNNLTPLLQAVAKIMDEHRAQGVSKQTAIEVIGPMLAEVVVSIAVCQQDKLKYAPLKDLIKEKQPSILPGIEKLERDYAKCTDQIINVLNTAQQACETALQLLTLKPPKQKDNSKCGWQQDQ